MLFSIGLSQTLKACPRFPHDCRHVLIHVSPIRLPGRINRKSDLLLFQQVRKQTVIIRILMHHGLQTCRKKHAGGGAIWPRIHVINITPGKKLFRLIEKCRVFRTPRNHTSRTRSHIAYWMYTAFNAIIKFRAHYIRNTFISLDHLACVKHGRLYHRWEKLANNKRLPPTRINLRHRRHRLSA